MKKITEEYTLLGKKAYEEIKESIIRGELSANQKITETGLAKILGVSRTPIREALRRLDYEGFVCMRPNYGFVINELTESDLNEIMEVRIAIESEAARLAVARASEDQKKRLVEKYREFGKFANSTENAASEEEMRERAKQFVQLDVEFHRDIIEIAGNSRFMNIEESLRDRLYRFRLSTLSVDKFVLECYQQHGLILDAIIDGNAEAAVFYSREHILKVKKISKKQKVYTK